MHDTAKQEILEAIQVFAENVDQHFIQLESRVEVIEKRMPQLVDKAYLDDKMADLRGEIVVLCRKGNKKLSVVVEELVSAGTLSRKTADRILSMEPFAQGGFGIR